MTTKQNYHDLYDRIAALKQTMVDQMGADIIQNPELGDALIREIDDLLEAAELQRQNDPRPPDNGLAALVGLGPDAARVIDETEVPPAIPAYDENITSERLIAVGDLYYIYQHEKIGVFDTLLKLQQLFKAGSVRLSSGEGAFGLYQYDRRQSLRHTRRDRLQAYRRAFGYTKASPTTGAKSNRDFHNLLTLFMTQVAQFFRDKRISEVIRPRVTDPSFGSIAIVRRSGLDLRNNLKRASYGHINVLRIEMLQLLDEAFRIAGSPDIMKLYGADTAWDVIEEINKLHLNRQHINTSQRHRMAIAGRAVVRWLAQPHILNSNRVEFETLLLQIADEVEEWLTSAEALGISKPRERLAVKRVGQRGRAQEAEFAY